MIFSSTDLTATQSLLAEVSPSTATPSEEGLHGLKVAKQIMEHVATIRTNEEISSAKFKGILQATRFLLISLLYLYLFIFLLKQSNYISDRTYGE